MPGPRTLGGAVTIVRARLLCRRHTMELNNVRSIYQFTAVGYTSWHGFAVEIARLEGAPREIRLVPIASSEYPLPACRPKNSRLSNEKLFLRFGVALPSWQACLKACHAEVRERKRLGSGA